MLAQFAGFNVGHSSWGRGVLLGSGSLTTMLLEVYLGPKQYSPLHRSLTRNSPWLSIVSVIDPDGVAGSSMIGSGS